MEDSRKGRRDGEKGLWTSSPHVHGEKGKEAIVYKMKEGERKWDWKKDSKKEHWAMSEDTFCAYMDV